jgi:PKD repeat protein
MNASILNIRFLFLFSLLLSSIAITHAQSDECATSDPFCTSNDYTFRIGPSSGAGLPPGPDYNCVTTGNSPTWFHLRIQISGDINIFMESEEGADIDFVCWGPFDDPFEPCLDGLQSVVDCSFSPFPFEDCYIPSGVVGEYYVIMITNFFGPSQNIFFTKTSGTGETDCSIVESEATNNGPICVGETLELFAEEVEDATYEWTGPDGFSSNIQNPTIPNAQLANAGTYTLTVTLDGTSESFETVVVINENPEVSISGDFEICTGEETTLIASGANEYSWSNGATTASITVSPSSNTLYSVEGTSTESCSDEASQTVTVNPLPIVTLPDQTEVCVNETAVELEGGSPAGGIYSGDNVSGGNFNANAAGVGVHEILYTYTDILECSNTASAFIEVTSDIEVSLSAFSNVCENAPAFTLSGGLPTEGDYSGPGVVDNIFDPSSVGAGTYSITYTYSEGACSGSDSKDIIVLAKPTVELSFTIDNYCEDAEAITLSGGSPADGDYLFEGSLVTIFDPQAVGPGNYDIKYSYVNDEGCSDTAQSTLIVNPLPVVSFDPIPAVCQNSGIVSITQGQPSGGGGTGVYSGSPNIDADGNFNTNTAEGIYNLVYTYTDINGCISFAEQSVEVIREPQAPTDISVSISEYCINLKPEEITLACEGLDDDYFWYENDFAGVAIGSTKTLTITAPAVTTTYLARSETSCGNSDALSITVTVLPNPTAAFNATDVCDGNSVQFNDASFDNNDVITDWNWDFGDGNASTDQSPEHLFTGFGVQNIQLIVTNASGCVDTLQQSVEVFDNPVASFSFSTECLGDASNFISTSNAPASTINQWTWQMDGSTYTTETTSHIFSGSGDFTVNLTVETEQGCSDALSQTVEVYPLPVADFSYFNPCRSNVVELDQ